MNLEEIKQLLFDKCGCCYPFSLDGLNIRYYYDVNYIRAKKLGNILGKEVEYPTELKGYCLFEVCEKDGYYYRNDKYFLNEIQKHYSNNWEPFEILKQWIKEYYKR
jgi:hypothetical protein